MNEVSHAGHRQRLRERFMEGGLENFQDHEVLELLLFYCLPRKNTNELAHKIMNEFKSLACLFESDAKDISRRCGVSQNTAVFLSLFVPIARRYSIEKCWEKPILNSSATAGQFAV
jgi:DNA repair protein RadC